MGRFIRRLLDFETMQRESLYKARILTAVSNLEYYARLMATSTASTIVNRTDPVSIGISIFTGLVDGSF